MHISMLQSTNTILSHLKLLCCYDNYHNLQRMIVFSQSIDPSQLQIDVAHDDSLIIRHSGADSVSLPKKKNILNLLE